MELPCATLAKLFIRISDEVFQGRELFPESRNGVAGGNDREGVQKGFKRA